MYGSCSGMRILYYADTTIYSKNAKSSDGREADTGTAEEGGPGALAPPIIFL